MGPLGVACGSDKLTAKARILRRSSRPRAQGKECPAWADWRSDGSCHQNLSGAFSRTYEPHRFQWMLLRESLAVEAVSTTPTADGPVRGLQGGLRSRPRAGRQHQRRGAPRPRHRRYDPYPRPPLVPSRTHPAVDLECAGRCLSRMRETRTYGSEFTTGDGRPAGDETGVMLWSSSASRSAAALVRASPFLSWTRRSRAPPIAPRRVVVPGARLLEFVIYKKHCRLSRWPAFYRPC